MRTRKINCSKENVMYAIRQHKKTTLTKVCKKLGMSYETIRGCLNKGKIMREDLEEIAKYLEVDFDYLTGESANINAGGWRQLFTYVDDRGNLFDTFAGYEQKEKYTKGFDHFCALMETIEPLLTFHDIEDTEKEYSFSGYVSDVERINNECSLVAKKYGYVSEPDGFSLWDEYDEFIEHLKKNIMHYHNDKQSIIDDFERTFRKLK